MQQHLGAMSPKLRWLKDGPLPIVRKYNACIANGFRFFTREVECRRVTQNSGVVLSAQTSSFSSSKDKNPIHAEIIYYGFINEIVELDYYGECKILLFKCDWIDVNRGIKNERKFTLVNPSCRLKTTDPFVLASQVQQVWYVEDPKESGWYVVRKTKPRDFFDMQDDIEEDHEDLIDIDPMHSGVGDSDNDDRDPEPRWERDDIEGMEVPS